MKIIISALTHTLDLCERKKTLLNSVNSMDLPLFFLKSDEGINNCYHTDNLFLCPGSECYEHTPRKVFYFFEYCLYNFDFDYIFKCDHDTLISPSNFKKINYNFDFAGCVCPKEIRFNNNYHFGKCKNEKLNSTPTTIKPLNDRVIGGSGYFVSKKACEMLVDHKNMFFDYNNIYEDVIVSNILYKHNIKPKNLEGIRYNKTSPNMISTGSANDKRYIENLKEYYSMNLNK